MSGFSQWNIFHANNALLRVNDCHNVSNGKVIKLYFKFNLFLAIWLECSAYIHTEKHLVKTKKNLQLPGILVDNVLGRKIVRKNKNKKQKTVGHRIEAWRATLGREGGCELRFPKFKWGLGTNFLISI